jgi:hypothetical protein
MALKTDTDSLRDSINAATDLLDKHIKSQEQLVRTLHGSFWHEAKRPQKASIENHVYEYLTTMQPALSYNDPRVRIRSARANMADEFGVTTMGERAAKIQASLNQWSINDELGVLFNDSATDYLLLWCVWLTTIQDKPGWQGYDGAPSAPNIMRVEPYHFLMDSEAHQHDPMKLNGPRLLGHMWKVDKDDLLNDPNYNSEVVTEMGTDSDVEKYDNEPRQRTGNPSRDQVVAWDIWIPEKDVRLDRDYMTTSDDPVDPDDKAYNGTVYTVAVNAMDDGYSKQSYQLRPPQPCFCPPWGPYAMAGYQRIPGSPYPMSPLVAVAEQIEETNSYAIAAAEDARNYKRFGVYNKVNRSDGLALKKVNHGEMVGIEDVKGVTSLEIGGTSDARFKDLAIARDRLARVSGLSQTSRGEVEKNATATAENIAQMGMEGRTEGIKAKFRTGAKRVFRTAAWYLHYGDGVVMSMGENYASNDEYEFYGGVGPGMEKFDYFDMTLKIEPYSMEHTDRAVLQKRMNDVWERAIEVMQVMADNPHVKFEDLMRSMFEPYDIEDASEWFDFDILREMQLQRMAPTQPGSTMGVGGSGGSGGIGGEAVAGGSMQSPTATAGSTTAENAGQLASAFGR